jgi:GTPase
MTNILPAPDESLSAFEPDIESEEETTDASRHRQTMHETAPRIERVILVGVPRPPSQRQFETDEHLEELELLTKTAGAEVVEKVFQSRSALVSSTFIGKGKAEYIAQRCKDEDIQTVIFDDDLTPVQQRNLERMLERKVVDRTALILDIFALHARSNTAKTQVELAQLEYLLPRLTRLWTHLSKQYGGIRTKGPGETQIETDRRLVRDRIIHLKEKLELITRQRETQRKGRKDVTRIALVGYTNVGKSTLLNILTGSDVLVEDKLFATLDATVRAVNLGKNTVLFTDTVGFIRKLPPKLVASFKSTLDEVVEADIILHVVDISHPAFREQIDIVDQTLKDIHADGKPTITVLNKVDTLESPGAMVGLVERYPNAVPISAARGINLNVLLTTIQRIIEESRTVRSFVIRPPDFKLLAEFHRESDVLEERFENTHIRVRCDISPETAARILKLYASKLEEKDGDD